MNPTERRLIQRWIDAAMSHVATRRCDDGWVATVAGCDGAWGFALSRAAAEDDLHDCLFDWVCLKLQSGDEDIPAMEGLRLYPVPGSLYA